MDLINIKGVGPKTLLKFNSLNIYTVDDLLRVVPKFYWDMTKESDLFNAEHGDYLLLKGKISKITKLIRIRSSLNFFRAELQTQGFVVKLVWFNSPFLINQLNLVDEFLVWGKLNKKDKTLELISPSFEKSEGSHRLQGIVPIYPLKGVLGQQMFRNVISNAFDFLTNSPSDKYTSMSLKTALHKIHFPEKMDDAYVGKNRFYLENLIIQYIAYRQNRKICNDLKVKIYGQNSTIVDDIIESLPYKLTESQSIAIDEIIQDLRGSLRTNRMLLGDVGSGKTVVALIASAYVIRNGYQAAIMVPTEILASQHFKKAVEVLARFNVRMTVLTSSTKTAERKKILKELANGEIDLIIGTQSLLNKDVVFNNLSFIVIDELHRFGVKQKGQLEIKTDKCDVLSMSATPIPRAIALTIYGDLKISNLEPRANTANVETNIIYDKHLDKLWNFIYERSLNNEQAYIVCPLVTDSEGLEVYSAKQLYKDLQNTQLKNARIGLIYGSLKDSEKDRIMQSFYNHEIDVLVATSVIEVGIDSQFASSITVLNADRFGLASLHQLRGRVGRRAGLKSYCFLHTNNEFENVRLEALKSNSNGQAIAEIDATIRGYGDFLGIKQSGGKNLKNAALITKDMMEKARDVSESVLADPLIDIKDFYNIDLYLDSLQQISLN